MYRSSSQEGVLLDQEAPPVAGLLGVLVCPEKALWPAPSLSSREDPDSWALCSWVLFQEVLVHSLPVSPTSSSRCKFLELSQPMVSPAAFPFPVSIPLPQKEAQTPVGHALHLPSQTWAHLQPEHLAEGEVAW